MRRLAISTVRKAFSSIGFEESGGGMLLNQKVNTARLFVIFYPQAYFTISQGRWKSADNVHVVSHWLWPKSMQELSDIIRKVISIYWHEIFI